MTTVMVTITVTASSAALTARRTTGSTHSPCAMASMFALTVALSPSGNASRCSFAPFSSVTAHLGDDLGASVEGQVATVVRTLDRAAADGNPVPRWTPLLNSLHMDLNRWGFVPAEECLLDMLASAGRR